MSKIHLNALGKEQYDIRTKYLKPYSKPSCYSDSTKGFIVWRLGTGENVELLHIKTIEQRKGFGRHLFYQMLTSLQTEMTPYYSVFGFTRVSNDRAIGFYEVMGFNVQGVKGLYRDGNAVMFWQDYTLLSQRMKEYTKCG